MRLFDFSLSTRLVRTTFGSEHHFFGSLITVKGYGKTPINRGVYCWHAILEPTAAELTLSSLLRMMYNTAAVRTAVVCTGTCFIVLKFGMASGFVVSCSMIRYGWHDRSSLSGPVVTQLFDPPRPKGHEEPFWRPGPLSTANGRW